MMKQPKTLLILGVLFVGVLTSVACRTSNVGPLPSTEAVSEPTPVQNDPVPFAIPTAASGLAVVTGRMVMMDPLGKPYLTGLYLGNTLYAAEEAESPPLVSFSELESPEAVQDVETGQFVFTDIPPGEYALIIWTPVFSMIVIDPDTGHEMIFQVEADQLKDLGTISVR
jgi:hypothetical protein